LGNSSLESLKARIASGEARVGILGLGYVGLPLAVEFGSAGLSVTGFDLSEPKVASLNRGESYIQDVPTPRLKDLVDKGRVAATTDFKKISECDALVICVPTPLSKTKDPDLSMVVSAAERIAENMRAGQLVVLESTTYPGTTDELILPMLSAKGLTVGIDFFLAFSPERVDPGNPKFHTHNTPKVIGGMTAACGEAARLLYSKAIEKIIVVSSPRAAEMVKLLENTFRSVNIGLVNEVALMCRRLGVNVWEVIDAAATKPFGFMAFYPGPGLGGHCIPIDPLYLSWKLKTLNYRARFIELASEINAGMPEYVVERLAEALNDRSKSVRGSKIHILGAAYKKDIEDVRESPAIDVIRVLQAKGAVVTYTDSWIPSLEHEGIDLSSVDAGPAVDAADAMVIITDHSNVPYSDLVKRAKLVLDARNATRGLEGANIVRL
jgi:UDP-N-acetyl-D-glucosamine dehydrogenase